MLNNPVLFIDLDPAKFTLPIASVYPMQVGVVVDWPRTVGYKDRTYYFYSKVGTNLKSGLPSACYRREGDERIWVACDGSITED